LEFAHREDGTLDDFITIAWQNFLMRFPTEGDCIDELWRSMPDDMKRCICGSTMLTKDAGVRHVLCEHCHHTYSFTARTFFHRVRKVQPWLARIWFLEHGVMINSNQFSKLLGVTCDTARNIFAKLTLAALRRMPQDSTALPSSMWLQFICKRSRLTPANEHPVSEERAFEVPATVDLEDCEQMSDVEKRILSALSEGKQMTADQIADRTSDFIADVNAALCMLELADFIEHIPFTGYRLKKRMSGGVEKEKDVTERISLLVVTLRAIFHGVSRRMLQLYLVLFWSALDRKRWTRGSMLALCWESANVSRAEVMAYISPAFVKIFPFVDP
jgi:hypothetical protein